MKKTLIKHTLIFSSTTLLFLSACGSGEQAMQMPPMELPMAKVEQGEGVVAREYPASVEGVTDVEIRPQVSGYLQKIFIDEGGYAKAGQVLFKIDDRPYLEQYNTAKAAVSVAKASLVNANIDLERRREMVKEGIVSDLQLQQAQASYDAAEAALAQAQAAAQSAKINLDFTAIKAPVSGYIGRIPYRLGSLISPSGVEALTVLSDSRQVNVYFNMSEVDFIAFQNKYDGNTIEEKIKNAEQINLMIANGAIYEEPGRIDAIDGRFNATTGTVTFRAKFDNPKGALRAGNTGKIILEERHQDVVLLPIASTMSIQDKIYVFTLDKENKVVQKPITVLGKSGTNYMVSAGLSTGESYIASGFERVQPGMPIVPLDSSAPSPEASTVTEQGGK